MEYHNKKLLFVLGSVGVASHGAHTVHQALLLLDGDDVVKLLKLPAGARQDIEVAARRHGPVVCDGVVDRVVSAIITWLRVLFFVFCFLLSNPPPDG